jgi:hypothetical protein
MAASQPNEWLVVNGLFAGRHRNNHVADLDLDRNAGLLRGAQHSRDVGLCKISGSPAHGVSREQVIVPEAILLEEVFPPLALIRQPLRAIAFSVDSELGVAVSARRQGCPRFECCCLF